MISQSILTKTEQEVIKRKLNNEKLSKQDSYYLSVSIRPKLKQMEELVKNNILKRVQYHKKSLSIENKIRNIVLKEIKNVKAITLYGSVIQTNYSEYQDIDLLIVTKDKIYNKWEKLNIINKLEDQAKVIGLNLDIQILDLETLKMSYPSNVSLIYQLKDSKTIYGNLQIPKKINLPKINLKMKLDWSELSDNPTGDEIYNCIRNTLLVKLVLNKVIDNFYLSRCIIEELGQNLIIKLKGNTASNMEKKIAINYLNKINEKALQVIDQGKWEKIVISQV